MYLNKLSLSQKDLFLDLCIYAAKADNVFEDIEKEYIRQYCDEMGISEVRYEAKYQLDEAISKIVSISSPPELKAVIVELAALLLSDNEYSRTESEFMNKLLYAVNLDKDTYAQMIHHLMNISDSYKALSEIISGNE